MLSANLGVNIPVVKKARKQTPIGLEEERRAKLQTPVAVIYILGEHSSSPTSKGATRKGPPGEEEAECRSLQPVLFPPHASSALDPCQFSTPGA